LIPAGLALAWKDYFETKFPNLSIVFFSSCPSYNLSSGLTTSRSGLKFRRLRGRISMVAEGARYFFVYSILKDNEKRPQLSCSQNPDQSSMNVSTLLSHLTV